MRTISGKGYELTLAGAETGSGSGLSSEGRDVAGGRPGLDIIPSYIARVVDPGEPSSGDGRDTTGLAGTGFL